MQQIGINQCRMIPTHPTPDDIAFLEQAEIILLAGGSVEMGWRAFEKNGFKELILRRFFDGAVLIGVSAGAVQLGSGCLTDDGLNYFSTFGLLPFHVGVHGELNDWIFLRDTLGLSQNPMHGICIPSGGGIIYHWDTGNVEPVCKSVLEISVEDGQSHEAIIFSHFGETGVSKETAKDLL